MLTHDRNRATLEELERWWSLDDLLDAHLALDIHDELADRAAAEQKRRHEQAERKSRRGK